MNEMIMKIRDQEFGVTVEVSKDTSSAYFRTELDGRSITGRSWEDLRNTLMAATRRKAVKVSVPVMKYAVNKYGSGYHWRSGTATGIHQGTSKVLVTWDADNSGRTENEQVSGHGTYFTPLTSADQEAYIALRAAQAQVNHEVRAFETEHALSLHKEVRAAVEAEVARQVETDKA